MTSHIFGVLMRGKDAGKEERERERMRSAYLRSKLFSGVGAGSPPAVLAVFCKSFISTCRLPVFELCE